MLFHYDQFNYLYLNHLSIDNNKMVVVHWCYQLVASVLHKHLQGVIHSLTCQTHQGKT